MLHASIKHKHALTMEGIAFQVATCMADGSPNSIAHSVK